MSLFDKRSSKSLPSVFNDQYVEERNSYGHVYFLA